MWFAHTPTHLSYLPDERQPTVRAADATIEAPGSRSSMGSGTVIMSFTYDNDTLQLQLSLCYDVMLAIWYEEGSEEQQPTPFIWARGSLGPLIPAGHPRGQLCPEFFSEL